MNLKSYLCSSLVLAFSGPIHAGSVGEDLKSFWERTGGGVNVTKPYAYQGQQAGYATLGSLYVRTKPRNATLANIQLPSVRAGCGGIDIFGGSFSFISEEELIRLMEAIMQNAAGFAFELALESLSPTVQETVAKLRALLQEVNAMNINSCEAGQLITSSLWPKMDGASQHICATIGSYSGRFADRVAAKHGCGTGGKHNSTLNRADGALAEQVPVDVNYAWKAIQKNNFLSSNRRVAEFFMTMTGTIITLKGSNDNEGPKHRTIAPKALTSEMIGALVDGGTITLLSCDETTKCLNPETRDRAIGEKNALYSMVESVIQDLSDAISSGTGKISDEAVALIGMTSVPIYDTLINAKSYKYQFVSDEISVMSELVAIDLAMVYIDEAIQEMSKSASNVDISGDIGRDFQDAVKETKNNFQTYRAAAAKRYAEALKTLERLQIAKKELAAHSASKFATMLGAP